MRRGDYTDEKNYKLGFRAAPRSYINKALNYYRNKYLNAHFIMVSDDNGWCKSSFRYSDVHIISLRDEFLDLALLSLCEHTIITTGTFSFWTGWLAEGEVIYYDHPIEKQSTLGLTFQSENFFPQKWIPMSG